VRVGGLGGQEAHPRVHYVRAVGRAMTGLRSSSPTWGRSSASRETRSRTSCRASRSAAGVPRWSSSSGAARKEGLFILKVAGDSMIGVGIFEGDWVVVRRLYERPKNGDIVAVLLAGFEDEGTVKTYW
jgi:hypothetical protein